MSRKAELAVDLAGLRMKNPIMAVSGTCGYGGEFDRIEGFDIERLGGIVLKGITFAPREGNPPIRVAETPSGMLNSIGLQNVGLREFIDEKLPFFDDKDIALLANVSGSDIEEYVNICRELDKHPRMDGIELNISCPNVKHGGMLFGILPEPAGKLTAAVRKVVKNKPLFVKLTPNAADIGAVAVEVVKNGADGLSLINTLTGMAVDLDNRKPLLGNVVGGLSGPCIKPVALWKLHETRMALKSAKLQAPIIGMGGVSSPRDAMEFIITGANAVGVGTAMMIDPFIGHKVIEGVTRYLDMESLRCDSEELLDINNWVGALRS